MTKLRAECHAVIGAPAARIYAILADYRGSHPRILPRAFFTGLEIETGGQGAGTIIRARGRMLGTQRALRMIVAEPEPGRILTETDLETGMKTTFTVEPIAESESAVAISTEWTPQTGIAGFLERLFVPGVLRRVYRQELVLLGQVAGEQA